MLRNASSLLPATKGLSFSELQSLLPLASLLEPQDVDLLAKNMPKLQPHIRVLIPALPSLAPHFRQLMDNFSLLLPHLDQLMPLLPKLTGSKETADCLPFLLERRVLKILLDHLDDIPASTMDELPGMSLKRFNCYRSFLFQHLLCKKCFQWLLPFFRKWRIGIVWTFVFTDWKR